MLSGIPQRVIYSPTIKNWLFPHDNEEIPDPKRKDIIEKFCKYSEQTEYLTRLIESLLNNRLIVSGKVLVAAW